MHCRNCGNEVEFLNKPCNTCGFMPLSAQDYCEECGEPTVKDQSVCQSCNATLTYKPNNSQSYQQQPSYNPNQSTYHQQGPVRRTVTVIDEPNVLANLGTFCCTPWIGVILYFVWKDEKPIAAQSVCNWTIASFVLYGLIYLVALLAGLSGA